MCMLLMACDPELRRSGPQTAIGVGLVIVPVAHIIVTGYSFAIECRESYRVMTWHKKKRNIQAAGTKKLG